MITSVRYCAKSSKFMRSNFNWFCSLWSHEIETVILEYWHLGLCIIRKTIQLCSYGNIPFNCKNLLNEELCKNLRKDRITNETIFSFCQVSLLYLIVEILRASIYLIFSFFWMWIQLFKICNYPQMCDHDNHRL